MPTEEAAAVVCLALALAVLINAGLVAMFMRSGLREQIRLARRAARRARNPWEAEDQALEELRDRVAGLTDFPDGGDHGQADLPG